MKHRCDSVTWTADEGMAPSNRPAIGDDQNIASAEQ